MIKIALEFLTFELNSYLKSVFTLTEDKAILSSYTNLDGSLSSRNIDKVTLSLINIEPETSLRNVSSIKVKQDEAIRKSPSIGINLYVLAGATFNDYAESLKFISQTLTFFQSHGVFTSQTSSLDPSIDRLVVDLQSVSFQEWSHIWGMLGGKHTPAVLYKVRTLTIQEDLSQGSIPLITSIKQ